MGIIIIGIKLWHCRRYILNEVGGPGNGRFTALKAINLHSWVNILTPLAR